MEHGCCLHSLNQYIHGNDQGANYTVTIEGSQVFFLGVGKKDIYMFIYPPKLLFLPLFMGGEGVQVLISGVSVLFPPPRYSCPCYDYYYYHYYCCYYPDSLSVKDKLGFYLFLKCSRCVKVRLSLLKIPAFLLPAGFTWSKLMVVSAGEKLVPEMKTYTTLVI